MVKNEIGLKKVKLIVSLYGHSNEGTIPLSIVLVFISQNVIHIV